MQKIVNEKPYEFIPPHRGTWWPNFIQRFNLYGRWLKKSEGVVSYELRNDERLKASLAAGYGIMLAPNHCRPGDPLVLGWLARDLGFHVYAMASWHLFTQDRFTAWAIRTMGGFSVYREGVDRQAINTAIEILEHAERPLILFPEGAVSRTNDRLHALLDGVAFIARTAAKRRAKLLEGGKVVVHPIGIKYLFRGDLERVVDEVLTDIEHRFSWHPQRHLSVYDRIVKVGRGLLCLKEIEHFGQEQSGRFADRLTGLVDRLLQPLEQEWLNRAQTGPVVPRVKALRMKLLPDMVNGDLTPAERQRRWKQLADIYLAQQVSCYPSDYLQRPTVDRLLETLERYEEDLTDRSRVHGDRHAIIQVGEAIEVSPNRDRHAEVDPLMARIERDLQSMLDELANESPLYE
ncbi:MAG: 1-acyl-sn-glycerol-3-phosphate acyltransferase [Planctomycetaceae bacterium]|nr:1-acyl-sn-glycerol-3-phosphate acyltransferase [Planctomycetales bacterium]MCB9924102.1 1-acyl-sn-glycerol-3-phosphate acyltransferase [Planctomycetaceae bacterium]